MKLLVECKTTAIILFVGFLIEISHRVQAVPVFSEEALIEHEFNSTLSGNKTQRHKVYLRQLPAKVVSAAVGGGLGGGIGGAIGGGIGYVVGGPVGGGVGGAVGGGIGGAIGGGIGGGRGGAIGGGIGGALGGGIGGFIAGPVGGGIGGLLGGGVGAGLGAYYINDTLTMFKNDTLIILITHQEDLAGMLEADYEYDIVEI